MEYVTDNKLMKGVELDWSEWVAIPFLLSTLFQLSWLYASTIKCHTPTQQW